jgi:hypothetical protein
VPRTDQAALLVDDAIREVSEQMPAATADSEVLSLRLPDGPVPGPNTLRRLQVGCQTNSDFACHVEIPRMDW